MYMGKYSIVSFTRPLFSVFVGLLLSLQLQALEVKGIASYQELGVEYYVASLHLKDVGYNSAEILNYEGWQRLKIKVTAKRWSARKWKAQWQNNIAINNLVSDQAALNRQLALFTEFPKSSFVPNDEVIVEYLPEQGSLVTFNGHLVLKTADKQFYNYILNTWLGKFSPNRIFREQISGVQLPDAVLVNKSSQPASSQRIKAVEKWFLTAEEKRLAKLEKDKEAERRRQEAIRADNIEKQKIAEQKKRELQRQEQLLAAKRIAQLAREEKDQKAQQILQEKAQAVEKDKQEKQRLALQEAELARLKILNQQKYFYQLYQWEVRTRVNETAAYPPWAKQFNHQGVVEIDFSVNRSRAISNLTHQGEDISPILQQEVEKRLRLAVEAIALPKGLKGEKWSFSLRYVFDLALTEQETLLKPLKPL